MKNGSAEKPPPKSTDLEGWRRAIAEGQLRHFRLEAIAAAFQDLGLFTDRDVRNALTKHLSDSIMGMLRKRVGFNRPNKGEDIILEVHGQIFAALLQPRSADGKALRQAFGIRVNYRLKTALADELRSRVIPAPKSKKHFRTDSNEKPRNIPGDEEVELVSLGQDPSCIVQANDDYNEEMAPGKNDLDPTLFDGVRTSDEQIDVNRILESIPSYKKRLAFRLYMDDVPFKSNKGNSIAKAVGVSERTVRAWIEEIEADLKQNKEVQELLKTRTGAKP